MGREREGAQPWGAALIERRRSAEGLSIHFQNLTEVALQLAVSAVQFGEKDYGVFSGTDERALEALANPGVWHFYDMPGRVFAGHEDTCCIDLVEGMGHDLQLHGFVTAPARYLVSQ